MGLLVIVSLNLLLSYYVPADFIYFFSLFLLIFLFFYNLFLVFYILFVILKTVFYFNVHLFICMYEINDIIITIKQPSGASEVQLHFIGLV